MACTYLTIVLIYQQIFWVDYGKLTPAIDSITSVSSVAHNARDCCVNGFSAISKLNFSTCVWNVST